MRGFFSGHRNYHVMGVNSYLIRESRGDSHLLRVFHAVDNSIGAPMRDGDYAVAPHNHNFDIGLFGLFGVALNIGLRATKGDGPDWEYPLDKAEDGFGMGRPSPARLVQSGISRITPEGVKLSAEDIHSVTAHKNTAWLSVQLGPDRENHPLFCYSRKPDFNVDATKMYIPMSAEELAGELWIYDMAEVVIKRLAASGEIRWQA